MRTTKICPKCQSNRILRIEGNAGPYGVGNNIPVGLTIFSYVKVARYVCLRCGYSEEWIDGKDLGKLEAKYGEDKARI